MRHKILAWMESRLWHLVHPRLYNFWEWVVMPVSWGGRLGFRNYIRWVTRKD